jgi:hypothetical protein
VVIFIPTSWYGVNTFLLCQQPSPEGSNSCALEPVNPKNGKSPRQSRRITCPVSSAHPDILKTEINQAPTKSKAKQKKHSYTHFFCHHPAKKGDFQCDFALNY